MFYKRKIDVFICYFIIGQVYSINVTAYGGFSGSASGTFTVMLTTLLLIV